MLPFFAVFFSFFNPLLFFLGVFLLIMSMGAAQANHKHTEGYFFGSILVFFLATQYSIL